MHMRGAIMTDLLARLSGVSPNGDGWTARCPAHEDRHNSLSIHNRDRRWLIKCHAGCGWNEIMGALGLDASALFDASAEGVGVSPPTTVQLRNRGPNQNSDSRCHQARPVSPFTSTRQPRGLKPTSSKRAGCRNLTTTTKLLCVFHIWDLAAKN